MPVFLKGKDLYSQALNNAQVDAETIARVSQDMLGVVEILGDAALAYSRGRDDQGNALDLKAQRKACVVLAEISPTWARRLKAEGLV